MKSPPSNHGVVAAGHQETAQVASNILLQGGNAFDAAVAAMLAASVAEPVLASLGGGGFLTAHPAGQRPLVYDFFAQTPIHRQSLDTEAFQPIEADFGTTQQTFHIGMGSIATPGFIRGMFAIHRELCQLPLPLLMQPAITLANRGVKVNQFQHLISSIVSPILRSSSNALALHCSPDNPDRLINVNELHRQSKLADVLAALAHEGEELFYSGEIGKKLIHDSIHLGGHLRQVDLNAYQVVKRTPLIYPYRQGTVVTNPLPSLGGTLIAFAFGLLEPRQIDRLQVGSQAHLRYLARVICLTQQARADLGGNIAAILKQEIGDRYARIMQEGGICTRGTTQISIADRKGNLASMTLSNGEGSGYVLPDTGIMLNNMLGEEDLNPRGFHLWPTNRRLASMMTPTLVFSHDGRTIVTGSGGSNRIRSAVLQVISNLLDFNMALEDAVTHPRIHFENNLLSLEPEIDPQVMHALEDEFPNQQHWQSQNLFFGGAHTVMKDKQGGLTGAGDMRRGGVAIVN